MRASDELVLDFTPSTNTAENSVFWTVYPRLVANAVVVSDYFFQPLLTPQAQEMLVRINSFKTLREDWDGNGAIPPTSDTIQLAMSIVMKADKNSLPFYFTAPGPNGEIVIEFKSGNKEASIYLSDDQSAEILLNENDSIVFEGPMEGNYKTLLKFINR